MHGREIQERISHHGAAATPGRERQEKAEAKARAGAEAHWRNLLRAVFTRLAVRGAYADADEAAAAAAAPSPAARKTKTAAAKSPGTLV